jgi:hypothetical protein
MNEYYEILNKNFVMRENQKTLYIFYNENPKLGNGSEIIDKKMLQAALGGSEIEILN